MEIFPKKDGTRFLLPGTDFQVHQGMRGGTVFCERELIDLSAYLVCRRHGIPYRNGVFKYHSKREITHQIVCDHVSGRIDPFVL
jgi:hypothetical protein